MISIHISGTNEEQRSMLALFINSSLFGLGLEVEYDVEDIPKSCDVAPFLLRKKIKTELRGHSISITDSRFAAIPEKKAKGVDSLHTPLAFLNPLERHQLLDTIEQLVLDNVQRRLDSDYEARKQVLDPEEDAAWRHAATVNVDVPMSKIRDMLKARLNEQLAALHEMEI